LTDSVSDHAAEPASARLPILPTIAEAARIVGRRGWVYAVQIAIYALVLELASALTLLALPWATAGLPAVVAIGVRRLINLIVIELFVIACGTALFIGVQRAAVLGERPTVRLGLRMRRQDGAAWRAVLLYWLAAHLVPTLVTHLNGFAGAAELRWYPRYPSGWGIWIYWAWVCAVAPWLALGLPVALFEDEKRPFLTAARRLRGQWLRYLAVLAVCLLPGALWVLLRQGAIALVMPLRLLLTWPSDYGVSLLLELAYWVETYIVILLMSAAVAAAYSRLSPKFEPVYRVFD